MGLFGKWIPDNEWVLMLSPFLKILLPKLAKYDQVSVMLVSQIVKNYRRLSRESEILEGTRKYTKKGP